jgi:type IV secretion system protein VirB10
MSDSGDERGASPVARKIGSKASKYATPLKIIGGVAFGGAVVWAVIGSVPTSHVEPPADIGAKSISQIVPTPPPPLPQPPPQPPPQQHLPTAPPPPPPAPPESPRIVVGTPVIVRPPPPRPFETSFASATTPAAAEHPPAAPNAEAANGGTTKVAFKAASLPGGKAGPALDLMYTMMPQLIPCRLDSAIDSTLAGPISCHTVDDVLSPRGVVLMSRGTTITGEYKNDVKTGQARLFTMAATAITPEGIPVPLEAPMADGLGRAGTTGEVDNHYLQRFGAGILLAIGQSAVTIAQASLQHGGNSYLNLNAGGSGPTDIASEILRSQINIPPTITVEPGKIVTIVVRYPIDFSDAIKVTLR